MSVGNLSGFCCKHCGTSVECNTSGCCCNDKCLPEEIVFFHSGMMTWSKQSKLNSVCSTCIQKFNMQVTVDNKYRTFQKWPWQACDNCMKTCKVKLCQPPPYVQPRYNQHQAPLPPAPPPPSFPPMPHHDEYVRILKELALLTSRIAALEVVLQSEVVANRIARKKENVEEASCHSPTNSSSSSFRMEDVADWTAPPPQEE